MEDLIFVIKSHLLGFATTKSNAKSDENWAFEHEQVCGFIRQFAEDNVYNHICKKTHAKSLSNKLEELYASKSGNNELF